MPHTTANRASASPNILKPTHICGYTTCARRRTTRSQKHSISHIGKFVIHLWRYRRSRLRFDIDGIELCFRDTAYFPPHHAAERAHLMTELIQNIRTQLNERGKEIGKKLLLGARIYSTVAECARQGLDICNWIQNGLLDYISPQDTMYADHNLPYSEWSALTRKTECLLYPGLLPWNSYRARYRLGRIPFKPCHLPRTRAHHVRCRCRWHIYLQPFRAIRMATAFLSPGHAGLPPTPRPDASHAANGTTSSIPPGPDSAVLEPMACAAQR